MENTYKQFVELVTKWKGSFKADEFFIARLRLTFFYLLTATIILGVSSVILYQTLLVNITESIHENTLDLHTAQSIIDQTQDILQNRFLTIDSLILFLIVFLSFLLTSRTLRPIREAMRKQKRFIADASHELRTPIAIVISGLEVALRDRHLDLPRAKQTLINVLDEMREFSQLSNTLLDISKYERNNNISHERLSVEDIVRDTYNKMKPLALIKEINFTSAVNHPALIEGNIFELHRVLYNIINNAITYTPRFGAVHIQDGISKNTYTITIKDTGIGIKENMIGRIFDPFFQGDTSRHSGGAGLGLTLSKRIITSHKGEITVHSKENEGTTVVITLPLAS